MKPNISVVIATWRRPELLERCLMALANQSFDARRYEVIVVTDGPDLRSQVCVLQLRHKVRNCPALHCISLTAKRGPAAARNAGWTSARGELIVFTDDDCIPLFYFLESYWNAYTSYAGPFMAFTGRVRVPVPAAPSDYEKNISQLEQASFVTANCACTKMALLRVRGLDEDFTMAWREDSALEFACIEYNIPVVQVPAAIVLHPVRKAPWGVSIQEQKKSMFNALLYKKFPELYKRRINNKPPWYYYTMVLLVLITVWAAFFNSTVMLAAAAGWLLLVAWFTAKRLRGTSKSAGHVLEMAYTSVIIPIVSVYWNLYGAVKFKRLLL
jgi:glycosyltransferase involved in cell wall biosynthesis